MLQDIGSFLMHERDTQKRLIPILQKMGVDNKPKNPLIVVRAAAHDQAERYHINVILKVPDQKSQTTRMRVTKATTMKYIMKVRSE